MYGGAILSVKWFGDKLLEQINTHTPDALFDGGQMLVDAAASRAASSRKSGTLAESGYVATEEKTTYRRRKLHSKQAKVPKGGAVAGFAAFYARWVEYGTIKTRAKPFLRPALDELKEKIGAEIVIKVGKQIK
jgi:HK97 gp10 family phage protein